MWLLQSSSVSSGDGAHRKACEGQKEGLNPGFVKGAGMPEPLPNPGWERGSLEPQLLLQQCWPSNEAVPATSPGLPLQGGDGVLSHIPHAKQGSSVSAGWSLQGSVC